MNANAILLSTALLGLCAAGSADRPLWPDDGELTDRQMVALVDYLRTRFTDEPAWTDVAERVREIHMAMKDAR